MTLGLILIVLGVLIIGITTFYIARKNEGISWIEVLAFPIGLILAMTTKPIIPKVFIVIAAS
ncbi:hypothetical protein BHL07_18960 [Bacillus cereus]|nr:hypothetical protein MCCC1A01412_13935 [Bacillus anthracis]OPA38141.1 hypothetical protein BHL07_18960 [Bacillus cereus]